MCKLKTVNIKGKDYVEVNERLKYFRINYKDFSLESEVIALDKESITIKAVIRDENGRVIATGLAQEDKASSFINKTSYVENCETSAWGRALGNLGIGIDSSVATAEEVQNAINNQQPKKTTITEEDKTLIANVKICNTEKELEEYYKDISKVLSSDVARKELVAQCKLRKKELCDIQTKDNSAV